MHRCLIAAVVLLTSIVAIRDVLAGISITPGVANVDWTLTETSPGSDMWDVVPNASAETQRDAEIRRLADHMH